MPVNVWFVVVPWLVFGAALAGWLVWPHGWPRSPRQPRPRRRAGPQRSDQRPRDDDDADLSMSLINVGDAANVTAANADPSFPQNRSHV